MATYQSADPGTHPTFSRAGGKPKQNTTTIVGLVLAIVLALLAVAWLL